MSEVCTPIIQENVVSIGGLVLQNFALLLSYILLYKGPRPRGMDTGRTIYNSLSIHLFEEQNTMF